MKISQFLKAAAVTAVVGAALVPAASYASPLGGLLKDFSVRVALYRPDNNSIRRITDFGAWGGGVSIGLAGSGTQEAGASTSLSIDFHYASHGGMQLRSLPVSLNHIYHFSSSNGHGTYAGFCVSANTFGGSFDTTSTVSNGEGGQTTTTTRNRQSTVTRIGGGFILGANINSKMYVEGRYEWYDKHGAALTPEGLRAMLGIRF